MSLILDALRRRSARRGDGDDDDPQDRSERADAVLATLGYSRPSRRQGMSLKTLLLYGFAAVIIGFVGLTVLIAMLSPSAAPKPVAPRAAVSPATRPSSTIPAARGTAAGAAAAATPPPCSP